MLAGDLFGSITRTVSDPMLLVAEDGEVLGRNAVMRRLFPGAEVGADLYRLAADGPEQVGETLHRWARSGRPLAGSLALIDRDGRPRRCHCFGARASWARTPGPAVQVRLVPVRDADRTTPARGARERRLRARLEHEHAAALRLQRSLLPERVDTTRLRVAVSYAPTARGSEVGGDWYDVFAVSGTAKTGLVIGDVAGHGLAEAAVMAQLRSVVRACSLEVGARPDRMADRLDGYVEAFLPEEMATMAYAVHDPDAARLCYCIAGHVPPILLRADGRCEPLPGRPDPPLGCALGMRHRRRWKRTAPGDLLVLYTDGVVERRGASIDQGVDALTGLLRSLGDGGETEPSEVCSAVMEWSDEGGRADDRAVLVAEL